MLDVVFSEDDCRLQSDDGQKSLNAFRKLAIFLHRNYLKSSGCKQSAKYNMLKCLINEKLLLRIIKILCNGRGMEARPFHKILLIQNIADY
jgi:hypothetical protein